MPLAVGVILAVVTFVLCRFVGFERDRAVYPIVLIVIASYYVLFAIIGASLQAAFAESSVMLAFALAAIAGFRRSLWIIVAALAAHGLIDLAHGRFIANPGVPRWWPNFCLTYDVVIAACLASTLVRQRSLESQPHRPGARSQS